MKPDNFWKNWQWRKTQFNSGGGFVELTFFSNSFEHCERTMREACNKLELSDFGIAPCNGGGYEGRLCGPGGGERDLSPRGTMREAFEYLDAMETAINIMKGKPQ